MNGSAVADHQLDRYLIPASQALPRRLFSAEAMAAAGTNLLVTGIYFYTTSRFQWGLKQNFLLATGQGVFYVAGALSAHPLTRIVEPRRAMGFIYALMALLALLALASKTAIALTILLLAYNLIASISWPIIESLVSSGVDSHGVARRIGFYNLVWSFVSVIMVAVDGTLIEHWRSGVFLIPAMAHACSSILMLTRSRGSNFNETSVGSALADASPENVAPFKNASAKADPTHHDRLRSDVVGDELASPENVAPFKNASAKADPTHRDRSRSDVVGDELAAVPDGPEPELLRVRTLALWLSRVALPATYVVIFSLMALMPSLPVMKRLDPATQTLLCSTWLLSRWLTFLVLSMGTWWHTRPRLLLIAALVMLFAFFGVTLRPSEFFAHVSTAADIPAMIVAQLALGAALGVIYSSSLYFGMVLSEGSTEHGGYHEALIGLGFVLGPGVGALAQTVRPGSVYTGIVAVGTVVFLSVLAVGVTSIVVRRSEGPPLASS